MARNAVNFEEVRRLVVALRKPDLHECLERLNMRKSGNKPELQQRLLDIFADSYHLINNGHGPPRDMYRVTAAQRVIEDVYTKLTSGGGYGSGGGGAHAAEDTKPRAAGGGAATAPYAAAGGNSAAAAADALLAGAMNAYFRERAAAAAGAPAPVVVCCPCGSTSDRQPLVQCRDCGARQHRQCVGLETRPTGGAAASFFCEVCRAKRADPFWAVEESSITASMRMSSNGKQMAVNGAMQQIRSADRIFTLSPQQAAKLKARAGPAEYQLQLACLQLGDPVLFRFHWPLSADLRVNNVQYRVYSRNSTQKLGANARDEPANIGQLLGSAPGGRFHLSMQCFDNSAYVLVVLLVRRRSGDEVRRLLAPQLSLRDSVERVRQQLARDDDDELQTGATVVSLRCPILGARLRTPARFTEVPGLACFDLGAFMDSAARTRKWQCPVSMTHSSVHSLQIDTYMQRIVKALADHPSVMEVEVEADGSWRPAGWRDRYYSVEEDDTLVADRAGGGEGRTGGGGGDSTDGEEETDEEEELRRAAAAVAAAAGQKRKRPPSPDVIDLASSEGEEREADSSPRADGDTRPPPQGGSTAAAAAAGRSGRTSAGAPAGPPASSDTPPQPPHAAALAAGGSGAASIPHAVQHPPLRITLSRRVVTTTSGGLANHPAQPGVQSSTVTGHVVRTGAVVAVPPTQPQPTGSAVVAAGAGVVSTHRQHFEHLANAALARHPPHHHAAPGHLHVAQTAAPTPLPPPQHLPPPPPPPQQVTTGAVAPEAAAAAVGAAGLSSRPTVNVTSRPVIRIRMAAGVPGGPLEAAPPAQQQRMQAGVQSATPYQPQAAAAAVAGAAAGSAAWLPAAAGPAAAQHPLAQQQYGVAPVPHPHAPHTQYQAAQQLQTPAPPPPPPQQQQPQQHHQHPYMYPVTYQQQHHHPRPNQPPQHSQQQQQYQQQQKQARGAMVSAFAAMATAGRQGSAAIAGATAGSEAPGAGAGGSGGVRAGQVETIDLADDSAEES